VCTPNSSATLTNDNVINFELLLFALHIATSDYPHRHTQVLNNLEVWSIFLFTVPEVDIVPSARFASFTNNDRPSPFQNKYFQEM
jgi:hypothetical protein